MTLFASDPARCPASGDIRATATVSLADAAAGRGRTSTPKAADKLDAKAGDTRADPRRANVADHVRVRGVVRYDGRRGTDGAGLLMPLAAAQQLLGKPG